MSRGTKRTVYKLTDASQVTPFKDRTASMSVNYNTQTKLNSHVSNPSPPRYPLLNQKLSACANLYHSRSNATFKNVEPPSPTHKNIRDGSKSKVLESSIRKQAGSQNKSLISSNHNSFSMSQIDSSFHSKSISAKNDGFDKDSTNISLIEKVKTFDSNKTSHKHRLSLIKQALDEISKQDKQHRPMLKKIKSSLDQFFQDQKSTSMLNDIIKETKEELELVKAENRKLREKLDKKYERNVSRETRRDEVSEKLSEENKEISFKLMNAQKELKRFHIREKKYMKLISELKSRGYPVDDVYEESVKNSKRSIPYQSKVPLLPLADVKGSISISTLDSEITGTESQIPTGHNITYIQSPSEEKVEIPRLTIPSLKSSEFHQEFMSKIDEFSES